MLNIKKILSAVICIALITSSICSTAFAEGADLKIGDYINVGTYNGVPVTWRYIEDDDNGKLLVSDKVICFKRYDIGRDGHSASSIWKDSSLRTWLNTNQILQYEYDGVSFNPYKSEMGFLDDRNFTQSQRNLMKTVTQWTMVPFGSELGENGVTEYYRLVKKGGYMIPPLDLVETEYYTIDDIPNIYYGAAYQSQDNVFLLDEMQIYNMKQNIGTVATTCTDAVKSAKGITTGNCGYYLRTSISSEGTSYVRYDEALTEGSVVNAAGIRPAFYLNEEAIETMTGSGTADDPYVLNASAANENTQNTDSKIGVTLNDNALTFDQAPIIENDRVLVPFRAIFEALGAEVAWNEETETVTAQKNGTQVSLQINNAEMTANGQTITLDTPPQIVNDRTLVPVRAVSESLGADVDWNEETQTVIIATK